jgi:hypothetical protein
MRSQYIYGLWRVSKPIPERGRHHKEANKEPVSRMPGVAQPKCSLGFLELSRIVPTPSQNESKSVNGGF